MSESPRSLAVQTVIYKNSLADIRRAVEAVCNSAAHAVSENVVSEWTYLIGDCSPQKSFTEQEIADVEAVVLASGGAFQYTYFDANLGHGGGQNRLSELTDHNVILILNPDAVAGPDMVSLMLQSLEAGVGVVEARQLPLEHSKAYDLTTFETSWASMACSVIRREAFNAVGGFDHKTFFMYCDDVDISWRIRLQDYTIRFQPAARVYHDKRLTTDAQWVATEAESYYSLEAAYLLAYKFSRQDVLDSLFALPIGDEGSIETRARESFLRLQTEGNLPAQLDPENTVGEFKNFNYGSHRY